MNINSRRFENESVYDRPNWLMGLDYMDTNTQRIANDNKKEIAAHIKSIFQNLPEPQNNFQIDVSDLETMYNEAMTRINGNDQENKKDSDYNLDLTFNKKSDFKISESFKNKIRTELNYCLQRNPEYLQGLSFIEANALKKIAEEINMKEQIMNAGLGNVLRSFENKKVSFTQKSMEFANSLIKEKKTECDKWT